MRLLRWAAVAAVVFAAGVAGAQSAAAQPALAAAGAVTVSATVDGHAVGSSTAAHPVRLRPSTPASVHVSVVNSGSASITVQRVQLAGRVVGLTFFAFDTSVELTVPAHSSQTLAYSLDLTGLGGQATGLIGGSVAVYGAHGHELAHESMVTDVRGSIYSVYGLFGLALVLLTILALFDVALAIARHRMAANRWRRATRTLTPGIGLGLVLVFTLSAIRVWVPSPGRWLLAAGTFAVVFFVLGYLTPTPVTDSDDDDEDDMDDDSADTDAVPTVAGPAQSPWSGEAYPPPYPPPGYSPSPYEPVAAPPPSYQPQYSAPEAWPPAGWDPPPAPAPQWAPPTVPPSGGVAPPTMPPSGAVAPPTMPASGAVAPPTMQPTAETVSPPPGQPPR